VAGHDGRAELSVGLRHPNGGGSVVRLDEEAARYILDQAGVKQLEDLRGRPWDILKPALRSKPALDSKPARSNPPFDGGA
jgi:hypothetical protein